CSRLLAASPAPRRMVLNVAEFLGKKPGDNPHFWYNPAYVNQVAARVEHDLAALDPPDAASFQKRYRALQTALGQYQQRIAAIRRRFGGMKVAATEDIFTYLARAAGLDLISPPVFMEAVGAGNEPPAQSIVQFEEQLKRASVLVYNKQTVTPLTGQMKNRAQADGIPVVGITETVQPPDASFEDWMDSQIVALQVALEKTAGKRLGK
ncbi:MAG: zinc ABC transporter substrate-binding protein, partial [Verrucomicrobia bacterium]|nr:zinc ABC transporter substrate-binding protein [Verrucomicrobiota bacterium]